ncbi:DUF6476 family protein [Phaeobacter italicus]|jgi:predicted PurR-regulated permease PerM|nr:DUF6476 family protein [Phaeobacter italicus]EEB70676.1 conserved hypothetical protein [Ruegeria sp. R11]MEE2817217.1 DUF6476 family protein [Pseudomonadota bacterium]NKX70933.1 hypothetical protein [Rhodobacteraceae bacterium R_SAG1]MBO9442819.1 hypothetical protein [Phaeobacter italicus]MBY6045788.1 hypothetical protein [Phaeobacter italicus]
MTHPSETDLQTEPPQLKFLRRMVTTLTVIMICGFLVVLALLVIRLSSSGPTLPTSITLPDGMTARAVTFGEGWVAVVTDQDEIVILNNLSGAIEQRVKIEPVGE